MVFLMVLPLAVIKAREAEMTRIHMIRQCETDQQKSNRLKKVRDLYRSNQQLYNKNQLTLAERELRKMPRRNF